MIHAMIALHNWKSREPETRTIIWGSSGGEEFVRLTFAPQHASADHVEDTQTGRAPTFSAAAEDALARAPE